MSLKLVIVSPEQTFYSGVAESVFLPGTQGCFELLENHAPLISSLQAGDIVYRTKANEETLVIRSGFVEVSQNEVRICVEV